MQLQETKKKNETSDHAWHAIAHASLCAM